MKVKLISNLQLKRKYLVIRCERVIVTSKLLVTSNEE